MVDAYEDRCLERRVDGVRGDVGSDGEGSCTVAPTLWRVRCERSGVTMCGGPTKNLQCDLVRIAAKPGDVSLDPSQEKPLW